jgi:hypothetical protein
MQSLKAPLYAKKLYEFPVMHSGWEMDSKGWVVELADGRRAILLANHGVEYLAKPSELHELIEEYQQAISATRKALGILVGAAADG